MIREPPSWSAEAPLQLREAAGKLRQRGAWRNAPLSLQERKTEVRTTGLRKCGSRSSYRRRYRKTAAKRPWWGPRQTMPADPGEGEMVARVTFTLGLGHHSPASAKRDTSEREAGVVHWLQARATRRPAARSLWRRSREDTGALFLDAREQVAAHVANTGTGGRGGCDSAYRWAQGPSAPAGTQVEPRARPGRCGRGGSRGRGLCGGPLPSERGTGSGLQGLPQDQWVCFTTALDLGPRLSS